MIGKDIALNVKIQFFFLTFFFFFEIAFVRWILSIGWHLLLEIRSVLWLAPKVLTYIISKSWISHKKKPVTKLGLRLPLAIARGQQTRKKKYTSCHFLMHFISSKFTNSCFFTSIPCEDKIEPSRDVTSCFPSLARPTTR